MYPQSINLIEDLFEACIEIETVFSKDKDPRMSNEVTKMKPRKSVCEIAEGEWEESADTDEDDVEGQGGCVEAISQESKNTKTPKR